MINKVAISYETAKEVGMQRALRGEDTSKAVRGMQMARAKDAIKAVMAAPQASEYKPYKPGPVAKQFDFQKAKKELAEFNLKSRIHHSIDESVDSAISKHENRLKALVAEAPAAKQRGAVVNAVGTAVGKVQVAKTYGGAALSVLAKRILGRGK